MRKRWEGVHAALVHSTVVLSAEREFRALKKREPLIGGFESSQALVSFLKDQTGDRDKKNLIYSSLLRVTQSRSDESDLAATLLWLGLWPGLDAIYRRNLRFFRCSPRTPEDLTSELSALFTSAVHRADLSRINRVAATLVMNTERDLRDRLHRAWAEEKRLEDLPDDDRLDTDNPVAAVWESSSPLPGSALSLGQWLRSVAGSDAELLEAVLVYGYSQKEAAARLGLGHEAARKKYQRALARLSHFVSKTGVFLSKGDRR